MIQIYKCIKLWKYDDDINAVEINNFNIICNKKNVGQTVKYNKKVRMGRGFTLLEL